MTGVWMELCPACDARRPRDHSVAPRPRPRPEGAAEALRGLGDRDHARPWLGPRPTTRRPAQPTSPPPPRASRTRLTPGVCPHRLERCRTSYRTAASLG
jgi:hypothetical protein